MAAQEIHTWSVFRCGTRDMRLFSRQHIKYSHFDLTKETRAVLLKNREKKKNSKEFPNLIQFQAPRFFLTSEQETFKEFIVAL